MREKLKKLEFLFSDSINFNMKLLVVLSVVVALAAAAPSGDHDYLLAYDFDAVFANDEKRKVVMDCLLDKAPCGEYEKLKGEF